MQIGETSTLRLELGVAALSDTIAVSGTAPVLETTRTQVSSVVNSTAVANLPVNGRNFIDFVLLTPGVTRDARVRRHQLRRPARHAEQPRRGRRRQQQHVLRPGARPHGNGRAPYQFSQEAVQEFQVNANAFSAEFGRAGGAVINVVTKSGTNRFSGSVFEFYRDKALNANTAINESLGRPKSPYHYNQFGGVLGGPLVRDRHFFFANYDGQRNTQPNIVFLNVPANVPGDAQTQLALQQLAAARHQLGTHAEPGHVPDQDRSSADQRHRLTLRYNHQNFVGEGFENGGPQQSFETTGASKVYTRSFNATVGSVRRVEPVQRGARPVGEGSRAGRGQQREPAGGRAAGRHARAPHRPQFLQSSRDDNRSRAGRRHA